MFNSALYVSKATVAFSDNDVQQLVALATNKNNRMGITGFIRFKDGFFVQYIEGTQDAIHEMKNTLYADERHHILLWLEDTMVTRKFSGWAMHEVKEPALESLDVSSFLLDELEELSHLIDISKQAQRLLWHDVGVIAKHHDRLIEA